MWAQSSNRLLILIVGTIFVLVAVGWLSQPFGAGELPSSDATAVDFEEAHPSVADPVPTPPAADEAATRPATTTTTTTTTTEGWHVSDDGILYLSGEHEAKEHYIVSSAGLTADGHWFELEWGDYEAYNLNVIPHAVRNNTFLMIAQAHQDSFKEPGGGAGPVYSMEMICTATMINGKMQCERSPLNLPIASTASTHCTGAEFEWFNWLIGPSDPRVFISPEGVPYIIYVSASHHGCLGPWIHDLRRLTQYYDMGAVNQSNRFFYPTELDRPEPRGPVEKNWFAFWDKHGDMYIHYDIAPQRSFAQVDADGSVGLNLGPVAAGDDQCLARFLPQIQAGEHVHQATNSLAITLCKRSDVDCRGETYIMTVFHHKMYYAHNLYEPYLMLFEQEAPFDVHAISSKPFWVSGRGLPGQSWSSDPDQATDQSQMMFMVSMNWKETGVHYRGYLDDVLIISFGVEDRRSGAIDVVAGDLVRELNYCNG